MKKVLFPILALILAVGLALPMASASPVAAQDGGTTMTVVSDTSTMVTAGNVDGASYPYNAVCAWEAFNDPPDTGKSYWDSKLNYDFSVSGADWIWESYRVVHFVAGDIVYFEKTFFIPGGPTGGILYITCDNGYEAYLNGEPIGSAQLGAGWETSNLTQSYVDTNYWQSVESWDITSVVQPGENILFIKAANEYMGKLDSQSNGTTYSNPAGLIFEIEITYQEAGGMGARTIGYWKTHPEVWDYWEPAEESIFLNRTQDELLGYFPGKGAQKGGVNPLEMLRAQLLAAELNVAYFDSDFYYALYEAADIFDIIAQAESLLGALDGDLDGYWSSLSKKEQRQLRQEVQPLKDILEAFNAMGDEIFDQP